MDKLTYILLRTKLKSWFYKTPIIWKTIEVLQGIGYVIDYFYYYRFIGYRRRFSVREINIEFASQCNLRCKFCSLDHYKPKNIINEQILDTFFLQFLYDSRFRKVTTINLHNGGEILLHPKRIEMLLVIKKYKSLAKEMKIHFPEIRMLTNGMLLRESLSLEIISLDVIDVVGFSFDGGTPELFEEMRTNAIWDKFYKNVKTFCDLNNGKIKVYGITCITNDKKLSTKWMHPQFIELFSLLNWYEIRYVHNWAGAIGDLSVKHKPHKIGCTMLLKQMVLLPNGDFTVCCSDLNSKGVIGNILNKSIVDIYFSNERRTYLKFLLRNQKKELDLCRDCETF